MEKHKRLIGYAISDVGMQRNNNEDNLLMGYCLNENSITHWESGISQNAGEWTCLAVFDGMGGAEGGEIASKLTAHIFQENSFELNDGEIKNISEKIENCFYRANDTVIDMRKETGVGGTTASVVVTDGYKLCIFHKGDSRVYLLRRKELYLMSKDHTLAQLKMDVGIYHSLGEVPEIENHQLTEFIGMGEYGEYSKPFIGRWTEWEEDDVLLICSDGLYDMCTEHEIAAILGNDMDIKNKAEELVRKALENGGNDNVTVIVVNCQ